MKDLRRQTTCKTEFQPEIWDFVFAFVLNCKYRVGVVLLVLDIFFRTRTHEEKY